MSGRRPSPLTRPLQRLRRAIQVWDRAKARAAFQEAVYFDRIVTALEAMVPRDATEILAVFKANGVPEQDVRNVARGAGIVPRRVTFKATGHHYSLWERK